MDNSLTKTKRNYLLSFLLTTVAISTLLFSWSCEKEDPVEHADLSTLSVTEISSNSAKSGGNIINDGGAEVTSRGLVWGTTANPSLEQHSGLTSDGSGTGLFTTNLSNLTSNTTYYVRSYAINSAGTAYGNEVQFITLGELATISTTNVTNITSTSATSGGNITDDGGAEVTARGVCWNTEPNPTVNNFKTTDGSGTGSFASNLTDLSPNITYYVRAYSTNSVGTSYGNEVEFTTQAELPTVTTSSITNITQNSATGGGNIAADGGASVTARGVVWSTSQSPTLEYNLGSTNNGSGTGSFTSNLPGLTSNTTYYVRAFATNSVGAAYGSQVECTTLGYDIGDWPRDTQTQVVEVTNPATGKTWMDRNLGASRAATSSTDEESYGYLYQWGRAADGHQIRTSPTTSILSNSDTPGHGNFITTPDISPWDWRSPKNDNLWQGLNGINNPCPVGYRLPTFAEFNAEIISWSNSNSAGAFGSQLKLPLVGRRDSNGLFFSVGTFGDYWTSDVTDPSAGKLGIGSSIASLGYGRRGRAAAVRCIKD